MFSLSNLFRRRAAKKEFARAKSEFDEAAAALVAANRAARASGNLITPEMQAASEELTRVQERLSYAKTDLNQAIGGPPSVALTEAVLRKVQLLFPAEQQPDAIRLLEKECGRNLPFHEDGGPQELERVRLAVLKLSRGNLAELRNQIDVAKRDWRDVLLFAERPEAMKLGLLALDNLNAESRNALDARDQKQYDDWVREEAN
jgi:hypothetical protein